MAGPASGSWLSALGAGVPYNREKNRKYLTFIFLAVAHFQHYFPANSDSSLTKVPSLQTTGSPQGTGFPSTSGQNSGTFGTALRGTSRLLGYFFEKPHFLMYLWGFSYSQVLYLWGVPYSQVLYLWGASHAQVLYLWITFILFAKILQFMKLFE